VELYLHLHPMLYDAYRNKFTFILSYFRLENCPEPQNHRKCYWHVHTMYGLDPCVTVLIHIYIVHIILTLLLDGRPNGLDSKSGTEIT
jgi:hypothetical protein